MELADNLANIYGTRCNTVNMSVARRNKYNMQEALAKDGKIRTCQQSLCRTEQEVSIVAYLCLIMVNFSELWRILSYTTNLILICVELYRIYGRISYEYLIYVCVYICLSVRCVISWPSSLALAVLPVS